MLSILSTNQLLVLVVIYSCISTSIDIYKSHIRLTINNNILLFGFISLLHQLLDIPGNRLLRYFANKIKHEFETKQWKKYQLMNHISKEADTIENFTSKLERASGVIETRLTWGVEIVISLIGTIIGFGYVLFVEKQISILVLFIVVNLSWFLLVSKQKFKQLSEFRKSSKINKNILFNIIILLSVRLHNGDCNQITLMNKKKELNDIFYKQSDMWTIINTVQQIPNCIMIMSIPFLVQPTQYLAIYLVLNNVKSTFSQASSFFNQWDTMKTDLQNLDDFWTNKVFKENKIQYDIPQILIANGTLGKSLSERTIKNLITVNGLEIIHGDRIRIAGPSGCGKTTLIRGMIGYDEGIIYDSDHVPENYIKKIALMRQDIRERTPVIKTSIRQLFYDETDDHLINKCLISVNLNHWINNVMTLEYDKPIDGKISGGEKTRLCLAITIYMMIKNNSKWLILDEPEQGLDPEQAPDMLQNIFNSFPDVTIFIITHICACQLKSLKINKQWNINNGFVESLKI